MFIQHSILVKPVKSYAEVHTEMRKIFDIFKEHISNNRITYLSLFIFYLVGIILGALSINNFDSSYSKTIVNYFNGFLNLAGNETFSIGQLLKASLFENIKFVLIFWIIGLMVVGFPLYYALIGMKGFITGFSSAIVVQVLSFKGGLISILCFLPKEIIMIPCFIAIAVNGIKFSKTIFGGLFKQTYGNENTYSKRIVPYNFVNVFFTIFIMGGIMFEGIISPYMLKFLVPILNS